MIGIADAAALAILAVAAVALSGGASSHEVWSLDQGTDRIHTCDDRTQVAVVEVSPVALQAVTPDDAAVWVAAIGAQQLVEIPLDLDADDPTEARTNRGIGVTDDDTRAVADWSGIVGADSEDGDVVNDVHGVGVRTTTGDERVVASAHALRVLLDARRVHLPRAYLSTCHVPT